MQNTTSHSSNEKEDGDNPPSNNLKKGGIITKKDPKPVGSFFVLLKPLPLNIQLRNITDYDLNRIMEIEKSCFSESDAYTQDKMEKLYRKYPDDFLVAEKEGDILGYIILYNTQGVADLDSLAVDRNYRSQGIGKLLVNHMIDRFKKQGLKHASLEVKVTNKPAISLFQSLGFKTTKTLKEYYNDNADAYQMEKEI